MIGISRRRTDKFLLLVLSMKASSLDTTIL